MAIYETHPRPENDAKRAMVCTANDLLGWKDFPKGLKVLLLEENYGSATEIRSKLEEMEYIVTVFCDENEALSAISNQTDSFHVAIVEVSVGNSDGRFKFLEVAKDLPTIMTSTMQCLNTMMKCIALGAVEFLQKPLSVDKLRNIWQHVVHKAFNAGKKDLSESLKPVKESVTSRLHLHFVDGEATNQILAEKEDATPAKEDNEEQSAGSDKYPAPSTPQPKQGERFLDDGDCQDQTNSSTEKEGVEQDGESKSVDTTCGDSIAETNAQTSPFEKMGDAAVKDKSVSPDDSKSESKLPSNESNPGLHEFRDNAGNANKALLPHNSSGNKSNKKKTKIDWTADLHKKFIQAVEQLGVDQAIPSRILDLMKVEGLTRHNVASHLQKHRMHRRHILPKEDNRKWHRTRDPSLVNHQPHNKPVIAYPSYQPPFYPTWGRPSSYQAGGVPMWGPAFYPPWQPMGNLHWKPYAGAYADAWGCPIVPPPQGPYPPFPQNGLGFRNSDPTNRGYHTPQNAFDFHPADEVIDEVVKEAISKPWLPLPIGLKPPSTESVLTELSREGISAVPPHINGGDRL